jgi:hypothetical protein
MPESQLPVLRALANAPIDSAATKLTDRILGYSTESLVEILKEMPPNTAFRILRTSASTETAVRNEPCWPQW